MKSAKVRKIRETEAAPVVDAPPAPASPPSNDAEPPLPAGQREIEGIRISGKASHWRLERQFADGTTSKMGYGVLPTGKPKTQWPLSSFAMATIRDHWGGGNYLVRFIGYEPNGKPIHVGMQKLMIEGEPKATAPLDEDDDAASPVAAGDAHTLIMKGIEMQQAMHLRTADLARAEITRALEREQADHQRRLDREREDAAQQLARERQRFELDMREREARWARERDEADRKAREAREQPEKFRDALMTGIREAVEPVQAKIAELEAKLDDVGGGSGDDDGDGGGMPTVKKVEAWVNVASRVFGGIFENEVVKDFVTRVVEGAVKGASEAAAGAGGAPPAGGGDGQTGAG